jgi:tRNA (mo5U34)-methyltransferase
MTDTADLRERIARLEWYHTIELAPGVVTPGWFDTRDVVKRLPFPASLAGKRCLDIGTFDGFWAFELERRGASEIVAIDVLDPRKWDWPAGSGESAIGAIGERKGRGEGFLVARDALGSKVERFERSVYELDPEVDGMFDFIYVGSLLLHLRDPVGALMRIRSVSRGDVLVVDAIDLGLTIAGRNRPLASFDGAGRPWWWKPNLATLARMVEAAGFTLLRRPSRCFMPAGVAQGPTTFSPRMLRGKAGREALMRERVGDPHGVILAQPAVAL